jgi:peptidoglycan hydrolase CwlO-like protein
MAKFKKMSLIILASAFISGSVMLTGCGGGISEEQYRELQDLQAQVDQLQKDKSALEAGKSSIQKQIQDKDAKLKNLQKDIDMLKNCK